MKLTFIWLNLISFLNSYSQTLSSPESVEWDQANNRWLIANTGNGTIVTRSLTGTLGAFASGIPSGPYGIEILGDVVYACEGAFIRGYNLSTGANVFTLNLGAGFLNGLTTDGVFFLYATDFSGKKIFKINTIDTTFSIIASGLLKTPNGIIYDEQNNRCVYVTWGANAPIMGIDLSTFTVSTLLATTLSNCDGITRDSCGNYYVTAWGNNKLNKFRNSLTGTHTIIPGTLSNPADIDCKFGENEDIVGISNTSNSTLLFTNLAKPQAVISLSGNILSTSAIFETYQWYVNNILIVGAISQNLVLDAVGEYNCLVTQGGCNAVSNTVGFNLSNQSFNDISLLAFPNPSKSKITIPYFGENNISFSVLNMLGQEVLNGTLSDKNDSDISIVDLKSGSYFLNLYYNNQTKTIKFIKE